MAEIIAPCGGIILDDTQFSIDEDKVIHVVGGGSGSGDVTSVNGKTGVVVLTAEDVGADATGTATTQISTHNSNESAHSDIRQMITSLNAGSVGADPAGTANSAVDTHNSSGTAHNDIRELISGLTASSVGADPTGTATTAVSEHNASGEAHTDIRTTIENLTASDVGADATGTASSAVNTHNTAGDAHSDIRTNINNVIKGDYFSTTGTLLSTNKQTSGVTVSITPMSAITDATGAEDVVTQFNALLAAMRTAGLIAGA